MTHADDGFGNLVDVKNPFGFFTQIYTRIDGKLASFEAGTSDHVQAIRIVRQSLGHTALGRNRFDSGAVLAVVPAKRAVA